MKDFKDAINNGSLFSKVSLAEEIRSLESRLKSISIEDKWHAIYCIVEEMERRGLSEIRKKSGFLTFEETCQKLKEIEGSMATQGRKGDYYIQKQEDGFIGFTNIKHITPQGGFLKYLDDITKQAEWILKEAKKHQ